MKPVPPIVVTAAMLTTLSSCTRWVERPLIGRYHLVHPTGCRDDIQDSTLVVRDDGTFDQQVQLKSAGTRPLKMDAGRTTDQNSELTSRGFSFSAETSFWPEPSHPAIIFVNRSADCWYQHPK